MIGVIIPDCTVHYSCNVCGLVFLRNGVWNIQRSPKRIKAKQKAKQTELLIISVISPAFMCVVMSREGEVLHLSKTNTRSVSMWCVVTVSLNKLYFAEQQKNKTPPFRFLSCCQRLRIRSQLDILPLVSFRASHFALRSTLIKIHILIFNTQISVT